MAEAGERMKDDDATRCRVKEKSSEQDEPDSGRTTSTGSTSSPVLKRSSTTPIFFSSGTSATTSPKSSREVSPIRPNVKPRPNLGTRSPARSRENSIDKGPARGPSATTIPHVPSAAAIQRALSAAGGLHPSNPSQHDDRVDGPGAQSRAAKTSPGSTQKPTPRTPRLSSPPPAASSGLSKPTVNPSNSSRKREQTQSTSSTPSIKGDRPNLAAQLADTDPKDESILTRSGMRTPTRGPSGAVTPLETVQEASLPSTPAIGVGKSLEKSAGHERPERIEESPMEEALAKGGKAKAESGNESSGSRGGGRKSGDEAKEGRKPVSTAAACATKPPTVHSSKSYTQLAGKLKTGGEGKTKNMTVETETVSSVPQVALGGGTGERSVVGRSDTAGSLRLKDSTETIRPKKDKKKVARKAASLNAGTGNSRHFLRQRISARTPSLQVRAGSSVESSKASTFDSRAGSDPCSPRPPGSPTDTLPSGRSSFSSMRPPDSPSARFGFGLISFRTRTASSKADIFEAKVASAVGEADSSDSEETFVYESNPPEPLSARTHKFHSRTPSTASTLSQMDYFGTKVRQESHQSIVKKKSMKFATNYGSLAHPNEIEGAVRGPSGGSRGGPPHHHHHHIGRFGRGGHTSIFDQESSLHSAKSPRTAAAQLKQFSARHNRQRSADGTRFNGSPCKAEEALSYDLEGEGADDERAPLMGSQRSGRTRRRPLPGSVRQTYVGDRGQGYCGRATAFASLGGLLAILVAAVVLILVLCTKPLTDVMIKQIRNVLASESEIMLDLHVQAINPNIIAITVSDLDLNVFAKSRHVGTSYVPPGGLIRRASADHNTSDSAISPLDTSQDLPEHLHGIDEGTDPIPDDPASDAQTMLLGRILSFDSPLIFEASPIHHRALSSVGEVRLSRPGNMTEKGGSARWERVLQHDFELIVRGVIKYSLPISSKMRSASIGGKVVVHPSEEDGEENKGGMRLSRPRPKKGADNGSNVIIEPPPIQTSRMPRLRLGKG